MDTKEKAANAAILKVTVRWSSLSRVKRPGKDKAYRNYIIACYEKETQR